MKKEMHERLNKRQEKIEQWFRVLHQQVDEGKIGGEEGRLWLDQFAVGKGLNVACGDFSVGDSIGVDPDTRKIASDLWTQGDVLLPYFEKESLDYIVTNYLESIENLLNVLSAWNTLLKPNGTLAIVCRNADEYSNPQGPLSNKARVHCFTFKTLSCYLARTGFEVNNWVSVGTELRVAAKKK